MAASLRPTARALSHPPLPLPPLLHRRRRQAAPGACCAADERCKGMLDTTEQPHPDVLFARCGSTCSGQQHRQNSRGTAVFVSIQGSEFCGLAVSSRCAAKAAAASAAGLSGAAAWAASLGMAGRAGGREAARARCAASHHAAGLVGAAARRAAPVLPHHVLELGFGRRVGLDEARAVLRGRW